MASVADERKADLLRKAEDLAEKLFQGPSRDQAPVTRNVLQSTLDGYLMGRINSIEQGSLLQALARRGNPLHRRSRQTGPQFARLQAVVGPLLTDRWFHDDFERRWVLGWAARLLDIRSRMRRRDEDDQRGKPGDRRPGSDRGSGR
jgi:hypothetical protein